MTTIAFDGKTLACDTQLTGSYINQVGVNKFMESKTKIVAFAGIYSEALIVAKYALSRKGKDKAKEAVLEYSVIEINKKTGKATLYENSLNGFELNGPIAIGSGGDFAMGAMLSGSNAEEAVRIAIKCDPFTGGEIIKFEL